MSVVVEKDRMSYLMCVLFACTGSIKLVSGCFILFINPVCGIVFIISGVISYGFSVAYFFVYEGYLE